MTDIVSTNADHPFEKIVVDTVQQQLTRAGYPFSRLPVTVGFAITMLGTSKSKLDQVQRNAHGQLSGPVTIVYNVLYLQQNPKHYIERVIRHEVAHVLAELEAMAKGETIEPHGKEYVQTHLKLCGEAPNSHVELADPYDSRPIRIWKHQVLVRCECPGKAAFELVTVKDVPRVKREEKQCKRCGTPFAVCGLEELHSDLKAQVDFIRKEQPSREFYR